MWSLLNSTMEYGKNVEHIKEEGDCKILKIKDETGEGFITCHVVFPGVYIMYSDINMEECVASFKSSTRLFCIDHCRAGRLEHCVNGEKYCYFKSGDLRIYSRMNSNSNAVFPLGHYYGVTIIFQIEEIQKREKEFNSILGDFNIDIEKLKEKFCNETASYIISGEDSIEHIFSELYAVPSKIKKHYFKIKVIEVLLYLEALELSSHCYDKPYFYKSQIEKVKSIHNFLISNLTKQYTIAELAEIFDIGSTQLKQCFKSIYGQPIFRYMRSYRMNYAARLLRTNKELKIIDISGLVGYDSPSKFAAAFKNEIGKTPLEYRKSFF